MKALTDKLSARQKAVFTLSVLNGLSADEISEITGLSKERIKSNLYHARKEIRKNWKNYTEMNKDNNLEKAIKILKSHVPETDNRDTIIENIVSATYKDKESASQGIFSYIFSWAEYPILRKALVGLSCIMIFVFTGQQILIINRIDDLEGRVCGK